MRIGRTLPPAAAPIGMGSIVSGFAGLLGGRQELDRFQRELKEHFGVKHCFLVSSGQAAFTLILRALKALSPEREEVLIPAFTCYSVPASIVRAGLRIRLCDMRPDRLDFDFAQLSGIPTAKVLAAVPTHLFGLPADVAGLRKVLRDPGVAIVEDAAQAMGEAGEGGKLGTLGDVGFFSLGRGKALSCVEGGVILTNRDDIAEGLSGILPRLPRYGLTSLLALILQAAALMLLLRPWLFWLPRSLPFLKLGETLFDPHVPLRRMSSFQAGLARNWRNKLEEMRQVRSRNVTRWIAALDAAGQSRAPVLNGRSLALPRLPLSIREPKARESLLRESAGRGLGIMPAYPTSIAAIPELTGTFGNAAFPVADRCARELVTLPTHAYLTEDDVCRLGRLVSRALGCSPSVKQP
jgi:dTDP-4-amino-4,6-dideoxygalactose transaminase